MTHRALPAASAQEAPARKAPPVRTCVGCRKRAPASELLRFVAVKDEVDPDRVVLVPDPARSAPGRGAHLHPDPACLALAQRRRAFGRALRVPGVPDAGALVEFIGPDKQGKDDQHEHTMKSLK